MSHDVFFNFGTLHLLRMGKAMVLKICAHIDNVLFLMLD